MNKKILIGIIGMFLIVGLVNAGLVSINLKEKIIPSDELIKLQSVNSEEFSHTSLKCNSEECEKVEIESPFAKTSFTPKPYYENCIEWEFEGLGDDRGDCLNYEKIQFTNQELEEQINAYINMTKQRVLKRLEINEVNEKTERVSSGVVEFKQENVRIK